MDDGSPDRSAEVAQWLMSLGNPVRSAWPENLNIAREADERFPALSLAEWERALDIASEIWLAEECERYFLGSNILGRLQ